MTISNELHKLQELHRSGGLTDEEFAKAKAILLNSSSEAATSTSSTSESMPLRLDEGQLAQQVRVQQIIAATLLFGVVTFFGITIFLVWVRRNGQGMAPWQNVPMITLVALAMLLVCVPLSFIMRRLRPRQLFAAGQRNVMNLYAESSIIGFALLEGPAFFGCVAYLLEAHVLALLVVGVPVALMLYTFPTEDKVRTWAERQAAMFGELDSAPREH